MKRLRFLALLLPLTLAACETGTPDDTKPATNAPISTTSAAPLPSPVPATAPSPTTTMPAPVAAASRVAATVGVPVCDDYIAAYRNCLTSGKVHGEQREALRLALQDQLRAWQSGNVTDLADACTTARTVARNTLVQYGCNTL